MGDRRGHGSPASMTPDHPRYKWWMVLTVVPAGLISAIDGTSVGIAIPSMMTSLRVDLDQIQWVVTTYLLMQTLLMPMTGWLTALLGRRRLFVLSLLLFMLVSLSRFMGHDASEGRRPPRWLGDRALVCSPARPRSWISPA